MDLDSFIKAYPDFSHIEEIKLPSEAMDIWQSTVIKKNGVAIGSGTSTNKNTARRIAIAETLERKYVKELINNSSKDQFLLNEYPTTCGFAFGFEQNPTKGRAIAEAVERWVWSKWINEKYKIETHHPTKDELGAMGGYFHKTFDSITFFNRQLNLKVNGGIVKLQIGISIGEKDQGVFPGSRVTTINENVWEHALLESWRHFHIFQKTDRKQLDSNFAFRRVVYFGENKKEAYAQIKRANRNDWPEPELRLLKQYDCSNNRLILYRALCKDFEGWHNGGDNIFIY